MNMFDSSVAEFITSCAYSNSQHSPGPTNSASNVPNATDIASVFLRTTKPIVLTANTTQQVQKTVNLSDGSLLTYMLMNATHICDSPLLLSLNNSEYRNDISLWWTITETVTVDFYNRLPIFLPPGRTHSIIVNTTRFPDSNMLITETTINNNNHAADIAEIFVNRNQLSTPYSHLHGLPSSTSTITWNGDAVTQYVVVVPPERYNTNTTSHDDFSPDADHEDDDSYLQGSIDFGEIERYAARMMPDMDLESAGIPNSILPPLPHSDRPFFFIWIENTSNFTLNYTIKVTQSTEQHLDLMAPLTRYNSPYLYTAFFNFTREDIIYAMDSFQTADDSPELFEMIFDLTTFQESFLERRPVMLLGQGFYPTAINHSLIERTIVTEDPNKPLLSIFLRLHHRFNLTEIAPNTTFHLRLDGVSYSPQGYTLQPMIIRSKPIPSFLPFVTNFTALTQEWVLFSYTAPPKPKQEKREPTAWESVTSYFAAPAPESTKQYTRVVFMVDKGYNSQIQAFTSKTNFANELKHEHTFEKDGETKFFLCYEMDTNVSHSFTLWNPSPDREPIDLYFSFRYVDACLMPLTPTRAIAKYALVILITIGSVLALLLVIFALYLCARPTQTEFLTASEEEAARIRTMSRSDKETLIAEAADYDKVPYLVRSSLSPHSLSTQYSFEEDPDDFDETDGLVPRRSHHGPRLAAAAFASSDMNESGSDLDNDSYY